MLVHCSLANGALGAALMAGTVGGDRLSAGRNPILPRFATDSPLEEMDSNHWFRCE